MQFDREQALVAYQRYANGSGSPVRLNFGECVAYALATTTAEPLLFRCDDYSDADVAPVIDPA